MQCVKDEKGMRTVNVQGSTIDICEGCGGLWLDGGELVKLAQIFSEGHTSEDIDLGNVIRRNDIPDGERTKELTYGQGISCPLDGTVTTRFVYAGDSQIILEQCPHCRGIWFDGDELVRLEQYIKPDTVQDMIGSAMAKEMVENERMKNEFLASLASIGSPVGLVKFLGNIAIRTFLNWERLTAKEPPKQ